MNGQSTNRARISRRRFLALAGGAVVTSMVLCGGGVAMVASPVPAIDFGNSDFGKEGSAMKVLVAYASRYGSTTEVAQAIGARLGERCLVVDVRSVEELSGAPDGLAPYGAVAVGSAVRVGSWLPAAVKFLEQNQAMLRQVPVAYFAVHFLNTESTEESRQKRSAYLDKVRAIVQPKHEAFFAGKIDPSRMSFGDKLATKVVKARSGDHRDWQAVRTWADGIFQD